MKIEEEGYLNKEVVLMEDIGPFKRDRQGICTADLKTYDTFAVWFREPVGYAEEGRPIYWVNFEWSQRDKFQIIGDASEIMAEIWKPFTDKIAKLK